MADIDEIDWGSLGAAHIPALLRGLTAENRMDRISTTGELERLITPDLLLNMQGSYLDLLALSKSRLPILITPFLIRLLENAPDLSSQLTVLELLHNLAAFPLIIPWYLNTHEKREFVEAWAYNINDEVREGMSIYLDLLNLDVPRVKQAAEDLLEVLKDTERGSEGN